jgi:two-component system chemotaxis sensor kinase CheA
MVLATGIERLQLLASRLQKEGRSAVDELVRELRQMEESAGGRSLDDLARLCHFGADTITQLAAEASTYETHAATVLEHLTRLVEFATECVAALDAGGDVARVVPPPLLTMPDPEAERHFHETVGMFVGHAIGALAELEEEILAVETAQDPTEAIGSIRRVVHTLKAEFGILNMAAAQKLCHQAETTIDACTEGRRPFPADVMLECADVLKQYLDRLTRDVRAPFADVTALLEKLRRAGVGEGTPPPAADAEPAKAAAADQTRVRLEVGGEFADSLPEFITEARSHLGEAEAAMLALEGNGNDSEHINLTFRAFHTIKGVAGFLNLGPLVELAHVSETLLDGARSQRVPFGQGEVDLILAAGDLIGQMILALEGQPAPTQAQLAALIAKLQQAAHPPAPGTAPAKLIPAKPATACHPPAAAAASAAAEGDSAAPAAAAATGHEPTATAIASPTAVPAGEGDDGDDAAHPAAGNRASGGAPAETEHKAAKVERTVKVSTTRLDMLVDMVGELVIAQSMVLQDPAIQSVASQSLARNIGLVGKITRDLQEASMSLRMVTVKPTFQKMARLVRDVAAKSGKKVALVIQGEDTELDRNVVEQISDPLVHMIRNAVDHGIDSVEDRRARGKKLEGRLGLRAYHQGGSIVIEIQDDGRGIDKVKVVKKAVEKGLLPPDSTVATMSDQEVFGLIFLPGFSTADKVTDLSGRGVGMDVVRRNIEALRGKIEIDSKHGEGTTFRLRLPLTLAIIDGMVVRVGRERYVVPTLSIEQSFRPAAADMHYLVDRGECVRVRGTVLPVHRLKQIFAQQDGLDDITQGILIVVEVDGERSCLFVDEIVGQQQVVIKSLGMQGERVSGVSGGAIMGDGRIALILDLGALVASAAAV